MSGSAAWAARSNITPILATQMLGDIDRLEPLVGALFAFGVETEAEARRALSLLRLDEDDPAAIGRLMSYRAGRCYMRDFEGQVAPVQIAPPDWLVRGFEQGGSKGRER